MVHNLWVYRHEYFSREQLNMELQSWKYAHLKFNSVKLSSSLYCHHTFWENLLILTQTFVIIFHSCQSNGPKNDISMYIWPWLLLVRYSIFSYILWLFLFLPPYDMLCSFFEFNMNTFHTSPLNSMLIIDLLKKICFSFSCSFPGIFVVVVLFKQK